MPPPEADTVMGYVPTAVPAPTVIVIVDVPEPGAEMLAGLKLTVVPLGKPEADNAIALLNPPLTVVVIVEVPCAPCITFTEEGDGVTVKLAEPEF